MTEHEFFKMLNNIDDELVVGAKPPVSEQYGNDDAALRTAYELESELYGNDSKPVEIKPRRRPVWKLVTACAACLAAIGLVIGAALAVNKQRGNMIFDPDPFSDSSGSSDPAISGGYDELGYPVAAKYKYEGDFSELEPDMYGIVDMEPPVNFYSLANESDLVVVGTFVDDARQNQPVTGELNRRDSKGFVISGSSYNKLRIDEIYKGNKTVGSEIVIVDSYFVNNGKLMYISGYTCTPMIKGERWVYFLNESDNGKLYSAVKAYCGRSPVPGYENTFALSDSARGMGGDKMRYPEIAAMLEKDPSVLRIFFIEHEGKTYNTVGYKYCGGVDFFVGITKDAYEVGGYVEVIGVVENNTNKAIGLYAQNGTGGHHGEVSTFLSNGDYYLEDVDVGGYVTDWSDSVFRIEPGEIYYQPMRFGTYKSETSKEAVPLGIYKCSASIGLVDDPTIIPTFGSKDYTLHIISFEIEVVDKGQIGREKFSYDGKTYYIVGKENIDGVKFSVGITQDRYEAGELVEVIGVVENNTNKPIGLWLPNTEDGSHDEVATTLTNGEYSLWGGVATAVSSHIIQPRTTYYQPMEFSTYLRQIKIKDTLLAPYMPEGTYKGSSAIMLLSDPNNTNGGYEKYSLDFEIEIYWYNSRRGRTIEDFPGVMFFYGSDNIGTLNRTLYRGMPVKDLYLIDLNGDGKRELCSTVCMGYGIIDERVMVYDYANQKLYELSDRGHYDYSIKVLYSETDQYYYTGIVKRDYFTEDIIWEKPFTLDLMTEVEFQSAVTAEIRQAIEGVGMLELAPGKGFTMEEFPTQEFTVTENTLVATYNKYGTTNTLFSTDNRIERVYLADVNYDGRREIIVESVSKSSEPVRSVIVIDYWHDRAADINAMFPNDDIAPTISNGQFCLVVNGKLRTEPIFSDYEDFNQMSSSIK